MTHTQHTHMHASLLRAALEETACSLQWQPFASLRGAEGRYTVNTTSGFIPDGSEIDLVPENRHLFRGSTPAPRSDAEALARRASVLPRGELLAGVCTSAAAPDPEQADDSFAFGVHGVDGRSSGPGPDASLAIGSAGGESDTGGGGGEWHTVRVGPMESTGGFDFWFLGWDDFAVISAYPSCHLGRSRAISGDLGPSRRRAGAQ